jgi:electron transfer flavoprotein beta subunit
LGPNEAAIQTCNRWFYVAKASRSNKSGSYDLIICGKESLEYNGGMVPGMLAVGCTFLSELTIDGTSAKHQEK